MSPRECSTFCRARAILLCLDRRCFAGPSRLSCVPVDSGEHVLSIIVNDFVDVVSRHLNFPHRDLPTIASITDSLAVWIYIASDILWFLESPALCADEPYTCLKSTNLPEDHAG